MIVRRVRYLPVVALLVLLPAAGTLAQPSPDDPDERAATRDDDERAVTRDELDASEEELERARARLAEVEA
ncbi:MAG: hypothetical protein ACLFRD_01195, partial [Nitriliruptoraceae bacterium]